MQLTGNTILITGGTSGIGCALAGHLHARGNRVILAGRRRALLDEITAAHPGMHGVQLDVQDSGAVQAFALQIREQFPELNVLVNNAGISRPEDLTTDPIDLAVSRAMVDTNILGVLEITAGLLPLLRRQPGATIITTTSGLAFVPMAAFPTYCASKAFLHSWLQSLRFQLRGSVEVLELVPPYVQTELTGTHQTTDPHAMPLDDYVAEVMGLLEGSAPSHGEILVERVGRERWAEKEDCYEEMFMIKNPA